MADAPPRKRNAVAEREANKIADYRDVLIERNLPVDLVQSLTLQIASNGELAF